MASTTAARREKACAKLLQAVDAIIAREGITPSALHLMKGKLIGLARKTDLFSVADFALPEAHGRNYPLLVSTADGPSLYLVVAQPGKEAAAHDHGIWCISAAVSGQELHRCFRRTDAGRDPNQIALTQIGAVVVAPGTGLAMADHDIHATAVIGDQPAFLLALYGYPLSRFPSVTWYHPEFRSMRASLSQRHAA